MLSLSPEVALLVLGILLLATVFAGSISSRFGLPALIGFLCLGMLAGVDGPGGIAFDDYLLTQGVGIACLIFILFSGGIDTDWRDVRRVATPALVLATGGVLISAGIMALAANLLLGFSPYQGFLLGAIIASTDAAAVFAILRSTGLDLHGDVPALIEVESGSNDPMAIFLVGAALMFITVPDFSPQAAAGKSTSASRAVSLWSVISETTVKGQSASASATRPASGIETAGLVWMTQSALIWPV